MHTLCPLFAAADKKCLLMASCLIRAHATCCEAISSMLLFFCFVFFSLRATTLCSISLSLVHVPSLRLINENCRLSAWLISANCVVNVVHQLPCVAALAHRSCANLQHTSSLSQSWNVHRIFVWEGHHLWTAWQVVMLWVPGGFLIKRQKNTPNWKEGRKLYHVVINTLMSV